MVEYKQRSRATPHKLQSDRGVVYQLSCKAFLWYKFINKFETPPTRHEPPLARGTSHRSVLP